jgi:hypothetical protein
MSGLVKGVKKVFKKTAKFVKKRWKLILIGVAVYFTAGIALSYFGSTAGFASAMPGFGVGGIFSQAGVAMGFQGSAAVASGLSGTSGVFAAGIGAPGALIGSGGIAFGTTAAEAAGVLAPVAATNTAVAAGGTVAGTMAVDSAAALAASGGAGAAAATGGMTAADAILKASSSAMKLQAASTLISTVGGLLAESPSETYEKQHELQYGQSFGVGRDGNAESGWASSGGSDAFKEMGRPARMGDQPAGGQAPSPYLAAMQQPTEAGGPFLPDLPQQQSPQMTNNNDFIKKGYGNQQGYMPYAS